MNCYYHTHRIANGQCKVCGKALCAECFNTGNGVCPICALEQITNERRQIRKKLILFGIIFLIITGLFTVTWDISVLYYAVTTAYVLSASMYGYEIAKKFMPKNLVVLRIRSAIFYRLLIVFLAFLIGWAVAPWRILNSLKLLVMLRKKEKSVLM